MLKTLLEKHGTVRVDAGETIITEGEPVDRVYILVDGEVGIFRQGDKRICSVDDPGATFGESSYLVDGNANATVRTVQPSVFCAVRDIDLNDSALLLYVARVLARRIDRMNRLFLEACRNDALDEDALLESWYERLDFDALCR